MSTAMISILTLILLALPACGSDAGTLSLDIIGSRVNNTTIISQEGDRIDVEIVGSTSTNLALGTPAEERVHTGSCSCGGCDLAACDSEDDYMTPWDDFVRPLCYPWTSYIPTRYNRPLIAPHLARSISGKATMVLGSSVRSFKGGYIG